MDRMASWIPAWADVTWGAGGSTSQVTLEICTHAQNMTGLETMMHLTCTNLPATEVEQALEKAKAAGLRNILALRGGGLLCIFYFLFFIFYFLFCFCFFVLFYVWV